MEVLRTFPPSPPSQVGGSQSPSAAPYNGIGGEAHATVAVGGEEVGCLARQTGDSGQQGQQGCEFDCHVGFPLFGLGLALLRILLSVPVL